MDRVTEFWRVGAGTLRRGQFIYIAASDLIPEIKAQERLSRAILHFMFFAIGLGLMFALAYCFQRS